MKCPEWAGRTALECHMKPILTCDSDGGGAPVGGGPIVDEDEVVVVVVSPLFGKTPKASLNCLL